MLFYEAGLIFGEPPRFFRGKNPENFILPLNQMKDDSRRCLQKALSPGNRDIGTRPGIGDSITLAE